MFSLYGITGQLFQGTLEEMKKVRPLVKLRPARPVAHEADDSGGAIAGHAAGGAHEDAVRAYRAILSDEIQREPLLHAHQIMQRRVITLSHDDDLAQAWRTLRDHQIHQAPVLDDISCIVGIVCERDLLTALNIESGLIVENLSIRVRDVMTTPVVTAAAVTDIRRIAAVMLERGVFGTPITNDSGELVGFISRSDILRAVVTNPPLSLWR